MILIEFIRNDSQNVKHEPMLLKSIFFYIVQVVRTANYQTANNPMLVSYTIVSWSISNLYEYPRPFIHGSSLQDRLMMIHITQLRRLPKFLPEIPSVRTIFNEIKMQSSMTVKYKEQAANEYEESRDRK